MKEKKATTMNKTNHIEMRFRRAPQGAALKMWCSGQDLKNSNKKI